MSSYDCPTVQVKSSHPEHGGYVVINESDFDPAKHERYDAPPAAVVPPPPPPPPPPPADPLDSLGKDWERGDAAELRKLAAAVSGRAVENRAQAVQVIQAALRARGK